VKAAPKAKEAPKDEKIQVASAEPVNKGSKEKAAVKEKPVGTNAGTPGAKATHTVKKGESASVIAAKYGVKTSDFLAWNNLTEKSVLQAGKTYKVYPPGDSTPPAKRAAAATPDETIHKVTTGQNPTTIARRYGVKISDLYKWNGWSKNHVLQVGDKVVIKKG
jgi:LysM repeat protein